MTCTCPDTYKNRKGCDLQCAWRQKSLSILCPCECHKGREIGCAPDIYDVLERQDIDIHDHWKITH